VAVKAQDITKQSLQVLEVLVKLMLLLWVVYTQPWHCQPKLADCLTLVAVVAQQELYLMGQIKAAALARQAL
jgi:hypothetical protein